jgi:hypothetical protein
MLFKHHIWSTLIVKVLVVLVLLLQSFHSVVCFRGWRGKKTLNTETNNVELCRAKLKVLN